MRFKAYGSGQINSIKELKQLPSEYRSVLKALTMVLPFRTNNYIIEELIDWNNVQEDPIFRMTFPQPEMLKKEYLYKISNLLNKSVGNYQMKDLISKIREQMNPHPALQVEMNVPRDKGIEHKGLQHKYPETVLFFPKQGQTCSAYCTYCFRWAQFSGISELQFAASDPEEPVEYLKSHPQVTDILFTGGDPLSMSAKLLRTYIKPLLKKPGNLRTVRIGTKYLSFWPYRFLTDKDSADLLNIFREIVDSGLHLAIMAHYSHYRELGTAAAVEAVLSIRKTGAEIRSQSPVLNHINNQADIWSTMWQRQVELGIIPYYMFIARNTGAKEYFQIPLIEAFNIYSQAISRVSGLGRTVRGPVMSCSPGKILVDGVINAGDRQSFALKFIQGRNPEWVNKLFFARFDENAHWIDDLFPLKGDKFFYEDEFSRLIQQAMPL